jgi:transcriptional regulator with XRE-family HTH domain
MNRTRQIRRVPNHLLYELMLNQGLTPNLLALKTGVSAPTIRLALKGHVPLAPAQFELAHYFGITTIDLFPLERQRQYV